jgi:hypothetical protein
MGSGYHQVNNFNAQIDHPFWNYGNPILNYIHRRVVRTVYPQTNVWGQEGVIPNNPVLGANYQQQFQFNLHPAWDKNRLSIVAFVSLHDTLSQTRAILNATEVKLSDLVTNIEAKEHPAEGGLKLFPNPVRGEWVLWKLEIEEAQKVEIQLFDINGRLLVSETSVAKNGRLYLNGIESGTYLIRAQSKGKRWSKKVVILP